MVWLRTIQARSHKFKKARLFFWSEEQPPNRYRSREVEQKAGRIEGPRRSSLCFFVILIEKVIEILAESHKIFFVVDLTFIATNEIEGRDAEQCVE